MILALIAAMAAVQAPAAGKCPEGTTTQALTCRALQDSKSGNAEAAAQGFEQAANAQTSDDAEKARLWAAAGNMWMQRARPGKPRSRWTRR